MKVLFVIVLTIEALSCFAKPDLSVEIRSKIEQRIAQIIQEETQKPCKQEVLKYHGEAYRVATGGVSIGVTNIVSSYKTKCGRVLIRTNTVGDRQNDIRSIKIDFDSDYALHPTDG